MSRGERDMCFGEEPKERDNIGLISFGIFILLIGIIFLITPNLISEIQMFFEDLDLVRVTENIGDLDCCYLPAPTTTHYVLYFAVAEFGIIYGFAHIAMLFIEFSRRLSIHKIAETASGAVFWFGAGYLAYSLSTESVTWFQFWAALIVVIGISIIVRAIIVAARPKPA